MNAKARDCVRILFAGEKARPEHAFPTPAVADSTVAGSFNVLSLEALVRMKLTSYRAKDCMQLRDLIDVGLLDATWRDRLPVELAARLQELLEHPEG